MTAIFTEKIFAIRGDVNLQFFVKCFVVHGKRFGVPSWGECYSKKENPRWPSLTEKWGTVTAEVGHVTI